MAYASVFGHSDITIGEDFLEDDNKELKDCGVKPGCILRVVKEYKSE